MGIEPTSKAWEAFVLPLNYTRKKKRCDAARSRPSNIRGYAINSARIIQLSRCGERETRRYQKPLLNSANDRPIRLHGTTVHNGTANHHRATIRRRRGCNSWRPHSYGARHEAQSPLPIAGRLNPLQSKR